MCKALQRMHFGLVTCLITFSVTRLGDFFCTLGNHSKHLATINLPKSPTFLGNFCKVVKIYHFSGKIIFGQLLDIWQFFSGHTDYIAPFVNESSNYFSSHKFEKKFGRKRESNKLDKIRNIAPWFCLLLPSCSPGFKSQAHHLCFFNLYY